MPTTAPRLDDLDRAILKTLMNDARTPYAEMAKQFAVSPATIHVRIEKMKNADIIQGTEVVVNSKKLGYDVCCFIGINLKAARDYHSAIDKLRALDEVVEAYYTTGAYNIFAKLMCKSIEELQFVLIDKLQAIDEVQSTETLISLQNPINRNVNP
ncbi:transcriptional regulator AsnC [Vibrio sp. 10N.286.49.B3]|uniref:transcriptional regulator AsnC n=1 Tax=Vibrio sp. 10N.286.49.B3 TaxID=1880855 RepID=UPI000C834A70|nr:transcriptional regulator AsnC [Vibrio sp. 10N.286.49.B3]PMH46072.1 transcriptional regulator AsnC [Vibrio sp. 10N.286.49.B3]